jgi:uridylate kinase
MFRRILLKLTGESLSGVAGYGLNHAEIDRLCTQIKQACDLGIQLALVIGGGNILRGVSASALGMNRVVADHMGMLATIINALALKDALTRNGIPAKVMSSKGIPEIVDQFDHELADFYLCEGKVVIFAGGTGNPFFSTDSAASLRAAQIKADALFKGTKVDGVYEGDPMKDPSVKKFDSITFSEVLSRGLKVMDAAAIAMCRDNNIPIVVFNFNREGSLLKILKGEPIGTIVKEDGNG